MNNVQLKNNVIMIKKTLILTAILLGYQGYSQSKLDGATLKPDLKTTK